MLGNHDFYWRSIEAVRDEMRELCAVNPQLVWLSESEPVPLADGVVLVGHDGWADGTAGVGVVESEIRLRDQSAIKEQAACADRVELAQVVKQLADEGTKYLNRTLNNIDDNIHQVIVATHVPPFEEACLYQGEPTDPEFLPHFCNPSLGQMLVQHATENPGRKLTVLCGHTHNAAFAQPHPQIEVHVSRSEYHTPSVGGLVTVGKTGEVEVASWTDYYWLP